MAKAPHITVEIGPAEAVANLVIALEELVQRNRDGDEEDVTLAVEGLLETFRRAGPKVQLQREIEPRTWSLPAEPGPEVKAVRDRLGRIWRPATGRPGWWVSQYQIPDADWQTLVAHFGPLTDATAEVQP